MSKLYELSASYAHLLQLAEDGEDVGASLDALEGQLEAKAAGIAKVLASLDAQEREVLCEIERLKARAKSLDGQADRLRTYLLGNMRRAGITRIKHALFTFSARETEAVNVTDEARVPVEYKRTKTVESVDKAAILAAWREHGECVPGAEVVKNASLQIK